MFSTRLEKQIEDGKVLDKKEIYENLNNNENFTKSDINNIDVRSPIEQHIRNHETKDSS